MAYSSHSNVSLHALIRDELEAAGYSYTRYTPSPNHKGVKFTKPLPDLPYSEKDSLGDEAYQESGREAWLTVAGAFATFFVSFGWVDATAFILLLTGPFAGKLFDDHGPRVPIIARTVLQVFGIMMLSISTRYWQVLLSHSICSALGAALVFYPGVVSIASWFNQHRGMAIGIAASGSAVGGVVLPITVFRLIPLVGFGWAIRTCGFMVLICLLFAIPTIKSRIPPSPRETSWGVFLCPFKEAKTALLACSYFFLIWDMFVPLTFIVQSAAAVGVDESISNYLVPILNVSSIIGRIAPNALGDYIGSFKVMLVMAGMTGILNLTLWLSATTSGPLIVYAVLIRISTGAGISLAPVLCAHISKLEEIGVKTGVVYAVASFAAFTGPPIGGALMQERDASLAKGVIESDNEKFWGTIVFAGISAMISMGGFAIERWTVGGQAVKI